MNISKNNSFLHLLMYFFIDLHEGIVSSKNSTPEKNKNFSSYLVNYAWGSKEGWANDAK
jgi:hypothetical protein